MKYLKLFQNHSNYNDFVSGGTMLKPNVSHCVTQKEVHYNPRESIVRGIIRTSDFNKIADLNVNDTVQPTRLIGGGDTTSQTCQFNTGNNYRKFFDLIQRENGVNVSPQFLEYYLFVTYSIDEYEMVKRTSGQMTVLLAQDGSLISAATYTRYYFDEKTTLQYLNESGNCISDESTGECMQYDGKYDVHVSYDAKLVSPDVVDDVPFSAIKIDGEEIDLTELMSDNDGHYWFEEGEYSIEYVLKDRREIPSYAFNSCVALEEVNIPNKVKKIDIDAFSNCPLIGTDENTIMRICSIDSEPIVVETTFDFGENEEKVLQKGEDGIFHPTSSDTVDEIDRSNYYVINNGVVADVNCVLSGGDIK